MAKLVNVDKTINGMTTTVKMTEEQAKAEKSDEASTKKRGAKNKSE